MVMFPCSLKPLGGPRVCFGPVPNSGHVTSGRELADSVYRYVNYKTYWATANQIFLNNKQ